MISLDIHLMNPETKIEDSVLEKQNASIEVMHPIMCWDVASSNMKKMGGTLDFECLGELSERYNWDLDFQQLQKKNFDALVLTDAKQKIKWVSIGFKTLTGYTPTFALGKRPSFLQGKDTKPTETNKIREAIGRKEAVKTTLINYRKDGSDYICNIEILPIFTKNKKLTHFLAVENLVEA
jgi:PAS domain S-box-containing protein